MKISVLIILLSCGFFGFADRKALFAENGDFLPHVRLAKDLTDAKRYDRRVRPVVNHSKPTRVAFSMSLYQILAINEKMQSVDLNVWVIQKWRDEFLGWNPQHYGQINTTILPHDRVWLPDTYLYNSIVMNREETERYINVVVGTEYWESRRGSQIKFMYPALYRTSCKIQIRYFPYDQQNCTLLISSWTSDKSSIDYVPEFDRVNLDNFIPNEEWVVVSFEIRRIEEKFVCCPEPWVLLEASLVVRRKPLYYIVNLVVPTSVITLVAVTGFFTPASTSNERREKLSLGIDSLLAMSILMMMVSEQMPTTSDYVPLFGLFYLSIIVIIFIGTIFTAFVLNVHLQKQYNKPIPPLVAYVFFYKVAPFLSVQPSTSLLELWMDTGVRIRGLVSSTKHKHNERKHVGQKGQKDPSSSGKLTAHWMEEADRRQGILANLLNLKTKHEDDVTMGKRRPFGGQTAAVSPMLDRRCYGFTGASDRPPVIDPSMSSAQQNWIRLARKATTKICEASFSDIPFADVSPGRATTGNGRPAGWEEPGADALTRRTPSPALLPPVGQKPSRPVVSADVKSLRSSSEVPSLRLLPDAAEAMAPLVAKRNALVPPAIFGAPSGGSIVSGAAFMSRDIALFDSKLRRRNAYEWEFLASVLDRVLLIVFAALVIFVTATMLIVGEAVHFSYDFQSYSSWSDKNAEANG